MLCSYDLSTFYEVQGHGNYCGADITSTFPKCYLALTHRFSRNSKEFSVWLCCDHDSQKHIKGSKNWPENHRVHTLHLQFTRRWVASSQVRVRPCQCLGFRLHDICQFLSHFVWKTRVYIYIYIYSLFMLSSFISILVIICVNGSSNMNLSIIYWDSFSLQKFMAFQISPT